MKQTPETIVLLNFVCEDIQKIARAIRDKHIYTMVMPYTVSVERLMQEKPAGLIICTDAGAPEHGEELEKFMALGLPVMKIMNSRGADLTEKIERAVEFCHNQCGCKGSWTMEHFIEEAVKDIREQVGGQKVVLGLSGGVDSSVAAALLAEAVGSQLTCVFVDHGLMRLNEGDEVEQAFSRWDLNFVRVDAEARFLGKLAGVTEPERKRKIIGEEFIRVFEEEAKKIGQVDFLAQGTIYPDVIESGLGNAAVIKSHHNVGGLPDYVDFREIIEPLRMLFKDEVRQLGRELGLPEYLVSRQPFPGPGLAIRVIGEVTKPQLDLLRKADAIFREEVAAANLPDCPNQYFAALTNMRSVGVMGDGRSYDYAIALRAVRTDDFMTADWARLPYDLLDRVSTRIVNEVPGVNRILYDVTSKPPATVEME